MKTSIFFTGFFVLSEILSGCSGGSESAKPKTGGTWTAVTESVQDTTPRSAPSIEEKIASIADQYQVKVGVLARNLTSGKSIAINSRERIPVTSMIKVPVVAAWYQAVNDGRLKPDARVTLSPKDKVAGSGDIQFLDGNYNFLLSDLAKLTIIASDNVATNALLDQFGKDIQSQTGYVNEVMTKYGLTDTRLLNKFLRYDTKSNSDESKNFGVAYSTASDLTALAEKLYRGEIVNREVSDQILFLMRNSNDDTMSPRFMPVDSPGFSLAHRSGGTFKLKGDFGLITFRDHIVSFAVICENQADEKKTIENNGIIATGIITKMLFDELTR